MATAVAAKSLHSVLLAHGYTHLGRSSYAHPDGHFATAGENGKSWMHNHTSTGNKMPKTGWGADSLEDHLQKAHKPSQHSEEAADEGTEQFREFAGHQQILKHGYSLDKDYKDKRIYSHPAGHKIHISSDRAWQHSHKGKVTTGDSLGHLAGHLEATHKTSQHNEEPAPSPKEQFNVRGTSFISSPVKVLEETTQHDESEQFGEVSHEEVLKKHGYKFYLSTSNKSAQYRHPDGHRVQILAHQNGFTYEHYPKKGGRNWADNTKDLDKHLSAS